MNFTTFPAYREAKKDLAIRGAPLIVYLEMIDLLDTLTFRPVKQLALATELDFTDRTVRDSIRLLVERGYVEVGPICPGQSRTYRLYESRQRPTVNDPGTVVPLVVSDPI